MMRIIKSRCDSILLELFRNVSYFKRDEKNIKRTLEIDSEPGIFVLEYLTVKQDAIGPFITIILSILKK